MQRNKQNETGQEHAAKPVVIVVEGCDNSGKTTVCEKLSQEFGFPVIHSPVGRKVQPEDHEEMKRLAYLYTHDLEILEELAEDAPETYQGAILDRMCLISDLVYGKVLREKPTFGDLEWVALFSEFILKQDPFVVYCRPPLKTVLENKHFDGQTREQYKDVAQKLEPLYRQYDLSMLRVRAMLETVMEHKNSFYFYSYPYQPIETLICSIRRRMK